MFKLNLAARALTIAVIAVHLMFFLLEAVLWAKPTVHDILLGLLNNPVTLAYPIQALVLRNLFINQGFYNLFLALGGLVGLYHVNKENYIVGYTLILFLCFAGMGAGVILACTTHAYLFAFFQAAPAAVAFSRIYPIFKLALKSEHRYNHP